MSLHFNHTEYKISVSKQFHISNQPIYGSYRIYNFLREHQVSVLPYKAIYDIAIYVCGQEIERAPTVSDLPLSAEEGCFMKIIFKGWLGVELWTLFAYAHIK